MHINQRLVATNQIITIESIVCSNKFTTLCDFKISLFDMSVFLCIFVG